MLRLSHGVLATLGVAAAFASHYSPGAGVAAADQSADVATQAEWRDYAGTPQATRYSPLAEITPTNIGALRIAWRWSSPDRAMEASNPLLRTGRYEDTPLMANGVLYTVTGLGLIAALDPGTGQTRWLYDPEIYKDGRPIPIGFLNRGLAYWTDGAAERLFFGAGNADLISIDARTGKPDPAFGNGGRVNLALRIRDAVRSRTFSGKRPLVAGDVVIVGNAVSSFNKEAPPGDVQAYDVRTGRLLWTFHVVPRPGEVGYDSWLEGSAEYSGKATPWVGMAYDPELDYVYIPTATATNDYYGGHRPGDNLFAESLICVEARTGKRVWHFQAIHHGLWDYDLASVPVLGDITVNGQRIKSVMQVSKQAFTYVFDRKTGEPVWPIEERPVPQSRVPGERTSPTQPFPTKPPAFDLQGAVEDNLLDFTPELKAEALAQLRQFDHGPLFTPPSEKGTVALPGYFGGANWGGAAFDPQTGVLYVPSLTLPTVFAVAEANPAQTNFRYRGGGSGVSEAVVDTTRNSREPLVEDLPIFKPPYARVTAIDMNRGEHLWARAIGNGPRRHPKLKDLDLPPLGDPLHRVGVLLTKTLLFVNVSRMANNAVPTSTPWARWGDPDMDRKLLYVFDKQTGEQLRVLEFDGLSASVPMTYSYRGTQYIVVAAGGGRSAELIAFSVPK